MARCPQTNFHPDNRVRALYQVGHNLYECACGCKFRWENEFTWEILDELPIGDTERFNIAFDFDCEGDPP